MKVYIGADHRGFKLKEELRIWFIKNKTELKDVGAFYYDPNDDYPLIAGKIARHVATDFGKGLEDSRGVVICGSGVGVDIVANKFHHIRSGLAVSPKQIAQARADDDINVLSIPSDFTKEKTARKMIKVFLETPFSKEEKKERRLKEIKSIENGQGN